jgi:hypothetical protein
MLQTPLAAPSTDRCTEAHHDWLRAESARFVAGTIPCGIMGDDEEWIYLGTCPTCFSTIGIEVSAAVAKELGS